MDTWRFRSIVIKGQNYFYWKPIQRNDSLFKSGDWNRLDLFRYIGQHYASIDPIEKQSTKFGTSNGQKKVLQWTRR